MALAIVIRLDFIDPKGKASHTKVRAATGLTLAQYKEGAQAVAQLIADINEITITGVSVTLETDVSGLGLKTVANILTDVFKKARMQLNTALAGFVAKFSIPTLLDSDVVTGTDTVDVSDPDWAALVAAETNGLVVTGGTIQPCDSYGNDVTSLQFAKEAWRRTNV